MGTIDILLANAGVVAALMLLIWLISLPLRDVSIVDIGWGLGFVFIAWVTFFVTGSATTRKIILVTCTTIWGVRLSGYLAWRNLSKPEDYRYQAMRSRYASNFAFTSLFVVFGLQGIVMWVVSLPIQLSQMTQNPDRLGLTCLLGVIAWLIGFSFESIGDLQLAHFKRDPANTDKVLDRGLWRYTRHPNYFGDFMVWWGLYLISFGNGSTWWSIVSPIVMSIFLMRISGVTLLEKALLNRKPNYVEYVRRTSAFFPMRPRSESS